MGAYFNCGQYDTTGMFNSERMNCPKRTSCFRSQHQPNPPRAPHFHDFIADDNGHLLPVVKQNICKRINHWGYPVVSIWDELNLDPSETTSAQRKRAINYDLEDLPYYFPMPPTFCSPHSPHPPKCTQLDTEFFHLRNRTPPVIWLLGLPYKPTVKQRAEFGVCLAHSLGFVYLRPPEILENLSIKYLDFAPKRHKNYCGEGDPISGGLPCCLKDAPKNIVRLVKLVENLVEIRPAKAFNTWGILEVIKMLFLSFPNATGFVIDEFPVNIEEAMEYEKIFWPVACGVYFTCQHVMLRRRRIPISHPLVIKSLIFERSEDYSECSVDAIASASHFKIIKVLHTDYLAPEDYTCIYNMVDELLSMYYSIIAHNGHNEGQEHEEHVKKSKSGTHFKNEHKEHVNESKSGHSFKNKESSHREKSAKSKKVAKNKESEEEERSEEEEEYFEEMEKSTSYHEPHSDQIDLLNSLEPLSLGKNN